MSRGKLRMVPEVCGDCGAPDPAWASMNRGVLLCEECCSVHRCLGRHISQVKHLKKGAWCPGQLTMVHALHTSGANSIWEHLLLEPGQGKGARRKPSADDCLHPTKADFIRAKHQNLAFVHRPGRDEEPSQEDLSQQLHSSVRTANLETSLRLLAQGAQPGMLHPEKGSAALHMAARAGQSSQVELLLVYGADPTALDALGHSPADYAREAGHMDLAQRLEECQFEVTDRLAFYLSGRKPDHQLGQHFILPEMSDCLELSELAKVAKHKLQMLPDALFAELARDVHDEVDRRENDAIWLSTQSQSALVADRQSVPFLPVNPELSSTRNQGRQKLARLNAREFASLIIDILSEAKRRHLGSQHCGPSSLSDDEPLYDSVASDEENSQSFQGECCPCSAQTAQLWEQVSQLERSQAALRHELEALRASHRSPARAAAPRAPPPPAPSPPPATLRRPSQRPQSMCEWRQLGAFPNNMPRDDSGLGQMQSGQWSHTSGDYDNSLEPLRASSGSPAVGELPSYPEVIARTERITKRIQELLLSAREGRRECFLPCTENILQASLDMGALFVRGGQGPLGAALRQLLESARRLQREGRANPETQQLIQCAYDVAKAAKHLVMAYPAPPQQATQAGEGSHLWQH